MLDVVPKPTVPCERTALEIEKVADADVPPFAARVGVVDEVPTKTNTPVASLPNAPDAPVTLLVPTTTVPALNVELPENVLAAFKYTVPVPDFVNCPTPAKIALTVPD